MWQLGITDTINLILLLNILSLLTLKCHKNTKIDLLNSGHKYDINDTIINTMVNTKTITPWTNLTLGYP